MNKQQNKGDSVAGVGLPLNAVRTTCEGWIPVSERLPNVWTEVMVWPQPTDQHMTAQLKSDGGWEYQEYVHHHGWDSVRMNAPTHWMPLPAPPSQLGAVSVPGEIAAGAQKQDHPSEIAELEQEASLMRARNERLQQERDALRAALEVAVTQNEHDLLLTGDELRKCRNALAMTVGSGA